MEETEYKMIEVIKGIREELKAINGELMDLNTNLEELTLLQRKEK